MAGGYNNSFVDELISRADIVSVVSKRVQLSRKGSRFWGLCPFHGEKTASFSVNPQMQMYYCFGCHAAGGAIKFVMEMDHLEFKEAVVQLAEEFHMEVPQSFMANKDSPQRREEKERLYQLNKECARYYYTQLWQKDNAGILSYFHERGLTDSTIRKFGLGASQWTDDAASRYLEGIGFKREEIVAAGVAKEYNGRLIDMFRGRAMFPIIDARGRVLGFGGRTLGKDPRKYMNTGDTPIFNKRMGVYAANLLRKENGLKRIILTEGYMDVISLVQAGVHGVCATLGTALTEEQARLLKRYAPEIWVSYDGDSAGQHAILRALTIFEAEQVPCRVLDFPGGMDPDEYVRAYGVEGIEQLTPKDGIIYRMERLRDTYDLNTQEGRTKYAIESSMILSRVKEPVQRENYIELLVHDTGFSREVLMEQIGQAQIETQEKESHIPLVRQVKSANKPEENVSPAEAPERLLLTLLATGDTVREVIRAEDFITADNRDIAEQLLAGRSAVAIVETLSEDKQAYYAQIFNQEENIPDELQFQIVKDCLSKLHRIKIDEEIRILQEKMKNCTEEERQEVLLRVVTLSQKRSALGKEG